jgi:phosphoserine phosphatase RsbX
MPVAWGAVARPKQNETVSGDVYLVCEQPEARLLVALVDGLGSGEEAAQAAQAAEQTIRAHAEMSLKELVQLTHIALQGTRGAVIGVLRLDLNKHQAHFVGVGNIGVHVYSQQSIKPISKNGFLGFRLPVLLELRYSYNPGDVFVLYSDGISGHFGQDWRINIRHPPQPIAEYILAGYGKSTDDATVVVVKT